MSIRPRSQWMEGREHSTSARADSIEGPSYPAPVLKSTDGGSTWSNTALARPLASYALLADALNDVLLVGTDFDYIDIIRLLRIRR